MNWAIRGSNHFSAPYRIYSGVKGFDAWHYGRSSFILGRGVLTLEKAKQLCEEHEAKETA